MIKWMMGILGMLGFMFYLFPKAMLWLSLSAFGAMIVLCIVLITMHILNIDGIRSKSISPGRKK